MRFGLMSLVASALWIGLGACGGSPASISGRSSVSPGTTMPPGPPLRDSSDSDNDPTSNDDNAILFYGHAASAADARLVTTLVKGYYGAAAAANGAGACSLLYSVVAETVPEDYAQSPGLSGSTCAVVMSKLFRRFHAQMAADDVALKVTRVRVEGDKGFASVYLGKVPEPYVTVHREGSAWKLESLFEIGLP